ncbi:MAG: hypothetical protein NXI15_13595 [Gammaproteobacteria bacterium]|jgi:hypothetical protein|nr:hypothetical protein [Gammaproteobacteria bacterium]
MKRLDDNKTRFVDFMRSIKFNSRNASKDAIEVSSHFAHFSPRARRADADSTDNSTPVRSGN